MDYENIKGVEPRILTKYVVLSKNFQERANNHEESNLS